MKKYFYLFFIFFLFLFSTNSVFAVATRIVPTRIDRLVSPGQVLEEKIKIANLSEVTTDYYFYLTDFWAAGEMGEAELIVPGSQEEHSLTSWIKITSEGVRLEPKEEKEISFLIKIPQDAGPGGYYGAIVAATTPPQLKGRGQERGAIIGVAQQTACLILLQISGSVEESAMIREFRSEKNFYTKIPFEINFISRIQNTGNVHIKPVGIIEIKNQLGKTVATLEVNKNGANVLPKTIRRFENLWQGDFGFGRYSASLALTFGTSPDRGGQGMKSLVSQTSFWILPSKIIIPTLIVFIIFLIIFFIFLKFYKGLAVKKALSEAGVPKFFFSQKRRKTNLPLFVILILIFLGILIILALVYLLFLI